MITSKKPLIINMGWTDGGQSVMIKYSYLEMDSKDDDKIVLKEKDNYISVAVVKK
jgi:hypothetical protein